MPFISERLDFVYSKLANRDKQLVKVFFNSFFILAVKCLFCGFRDTLPDHFPDVIGVVGILQNLVSKELFLSNFNFTSFLRSR